MAGFEVSTEGRCRKRGVSTLVEFREDVPDEDLYGSIRLSADVPLPPDERERLLASPDAPEGAEPFAEVSVVHRFGGGVTLDWLIERVQEWDTALAQGRREARRRPRVAAPAVGETVH